MFAIIIVMSEDISNLRLRSKNSESKSLCLYLSIVDASLSPASVRSNSYFIASNFVLRCGLAVSLSILSLFIWRLNSFLIWSIFRVIRAINYIITIFFFIFIILSLIAIFNRWIRSRWWSLVILSLLYF